ncbi:MAG: peptidase M23 [Archangium gephyra]|uniref:Peptidase M23 n=1 Tax=Archangium gephyra TaxID=48 RepID=A0A2W5TRQ1_9BACT|nr:MAG: peptidase M23 [Archangium gephyra]
MTRRAWLGSLIGLVSLLIFVFTVPRVRLLTHGARYTKPVKKLSMPVVGMTARQARDTWHTSRPGRRQHEGIDLFATRGTPVVSATGGEVWRVGTDSLGGRVVSVLGDGPALYYYAHLDDWAPGLKVGQRVQPGTVLGVVGNTGNARTTPPHLHFGVYRVGWLKSSAVNPAPLLGVR